MWRVHRCLISRKLLHKTSKFLRPYLYNLRRCHVHDHRTTLFLGNLLYFLRRCQTLFWPSSSCCFATHSVSFNGKSLKMQLSLKYFEHYIYKYNYSCLVVVWASKVIYMCVHERTEILSTIILGSNYWLGQFKFE